MKKLVALLAKKDLKRKLIKLIPYFLILLMALALLFSLSSHHAFWTGYDTYFHMNGAYEDAMQIKTGHFSYFISLFGFERSGRVVNALYGPVFNYLCGALLLWCHSWLRFEFTIFLITLIISGVGTYKCARALNMNYGLAMIIAWLEMVSPPVIIMWFSYFTFTGLGAAVLIPYVLLTGIRIVQRRQIRVVPLAFIMAVCLQIHLMTSLIAALLLIPIVSMGWLRSAHKWTMVRNGISAVVIAIALSGNVFGALYDVFSTNHLVPTFPNFNLQTTVNNKALSFQHGSIKVLGYAYTFLLLGIIILAVIKRCSLTAVDGSLLFDVFLLLWLSSKYFPWDRFVKIWPALASIIQYPIRFSAVIFIMELLLIGSLVYKFSGRLEAGFVVILILILVESFYFAKLQTNRLTQDWESPQVVCYWTRHVTEDDFRHRTPGAQVRRALRSSKLSWGLNAVHKVTLDYLPAFRRLDLRNYYSLPIHQEYVNTFRNSGRFHKVAKRNGIMMTWSEQQPKRVTVPLIKYHQTVATLNHRRIQPQRSLIGSMRINARSGINHLAIRYCPNHGFKAGTLISVIAWLGMLIDAIDRIKLRLKQ